MKERSRAILEISMKEFIRSGRPITSEFLYDVYNFGIKPAMLRLELGELSNEGYFFQNHPSGGRFPTDKAYRFYVEEIIEDACEKESFFCPESILESLLRHDHRDAIEKIADTLNVLSVGYDPYEKELYESGMVELVSHADVEEKSDIVQILEDIEQLKQKIVEESEMWNEENRIKIFIGKNPLAKSENLSIMGRKYNIQDKEFFLLTVGPKRMNYEESIKFFTSLEKSLEKIK